MNVFDLIRKDIDDEIERVSTALCKGSARTYEEYASMCAKLLAYESTRNIINERAKEPDDDDD